MAETLAQAVQAFVDLKNVLKMFLQGTEDAVVDPGDGGSEIPSLRKLIAEIPTIEDQLAAINAATSAALESLNQAALENSFLSTEKALAYGLKGCASLVGGAGGTDGTFDLGFTGGSATVQAIGRFVVSGGALVAVYIDDPGHYTASTAPTLSFAASNGLTGASAIGVMGKNVAEGGVFSVPGTDANTAWSIYKVVSGTAEQITMVPSTAAVAAEAAARAATDEDLQEQITGTVTSSGSVTLSGSVSGFGTETNMAVCDLPINDKFNYIRIGVKAEGDVYVSVLKIIDAPTNKAQLITAPMLLGDEISETVRGGHIPTFDPGDDTTYRFVFGAPNGTIDIRYVSGRETATASGALTSRQVGDIFTLTWAAPHAVPAACDYYEGGAIGGLYAEEADRKAAILAEEAAREAASAPLINATSVLDVVDYTINPGYFYNVLGATVASDGMTALQYEVQGGETLYVTGRIRSFATTGINFVQFLDGAGAPVIGAGFVPSDASGVYPGTLYYDYEFVAPISARVVQINSQSYVPTLKALTVQDDLAQKTLHILRRLRDRTAVVFGTSITEASQGLNNHWSKVSAELGVTIHNEGLSTSSARNGLAGIRTGTMSSPPSSSNDPLGWIGTNWSQFAARGLSANLDEKRYLIDNWDYWKTVLANSPPSSLSSDQIATILDASYQNRLYRHLGAGNRRDVYIFECHRNDVNSDMATMPTDTRDRGYYLGAMNFLVDLILNDNPKATICFVGFYEKQQYPMIAQAQEVLADYWDLPLLKLWEKLGWSQQLINPDGHWNLATSPACTWVTNTDYSWADAPHVTYSGYFISTAGAVTAASGQYAMKAPCNGGERMRVTARVQNFSATGVPMIVFFDTSGGVISYSTPSDASATPPGTVYTNYEFDVPAEARWVGINSNSTDEAIQIGSTREAPITQLARWVPDGLHPHTDASGDATSRMADIIAPWLVDVFRSFY